MRFLTILLLLLLASSPAQADPVSIIVTAALSGVTITGTIATGVAIGFSVSSAIIGGVLAGASQLLNKPKSPDLGSFGSFRSTGSTQQFRQPVTERRIVYGETRVSGPILFVRVSDDNKYLYMIVALASHEVEAIDEILINDTSIANDMLDGSGNVNTGRFQNYARFKKFLGTTGQTADSALVSEVSEWTSNHRLRETAYLSCRFQWDIDIYPSGIPNISAWVRGKKVFDTRDDTTKWTCNTALVARDYMTDPRLGMGISATYMEDTLLDAAANTCEEMVTVTDVSMSITSADASLDVITLSGERLKVQIGDRVQLTGASLPAGLSTGTNYYVIPYQRKDNPRVKLATSLANAYAGTTVNITGNGTGTMVKKAEPRYSASGTLKTSSELGANLDEILSAMAGSVIWAGGDYRVLAGEYPTPTISFDESDCVGELSLTTKIQKRERFNRVQGIFVSPLQDGNPTDYPLVKNDTYASNDGEILQETMDFSFTTRAHTAQRLAKISLERMRQELIIRGTFKLTAFKVQPGDVCLINNTLWGFSSKPFEVIEWSIGDNNGAPAIDMVLREHSSTVFDWNNGEETVFDPSPNTTLSSVFSVSAPTSLATTSKEIQTQQNDLTYAFELTWTAPQDEFVISGGRYELQFKRSIDPTYLPSFYVNGDLTKALIPQVEPATNYDVRIRAINSLGIKSAWSALAGFTIESPSGATIQLDWGEYSSTPVASDNEDWGSFTNSPDLGTVDYGEFV